jgi:sugar lactone lactonase YvrE
MEFMIRSDICAPKTPPAPDLAHEHICGRPLGLRFEKKTGNLWIADAYFGILKVGPEGGQAEPVVTEIDGIPMRFSNDLDFDEDGVLYFTDSSTKWSRRCKILSQVTSTVFLHVHSLDDAHLVHYSQWQ